MIEIRYVKEEDKEFWYRLDRHLPETEFEDKVRTERGYVLFENREPVGLLRYSLFWDEIPFCNLIFVDGERQRRGLGRMLMEHWEADMTEQGYSILLTSTRADELSQHFYRSLGYKDCGCLLIDSGQYAQPAELFLVKKILV